MSRSLNAAPTAGSQNNSGQDNDLSLETTSSQTLRGVRALNGKSWGFNPYDAAPVQDSTSATGMHRLSEMRRLSEAIRMQREAERAATKKK